MTYLSLIDGPSAAIVMGGTVLGTVLRCGFARSVGAMHGLAGAVLPRFDASRERKQLALQIQDFQRNGLLQTEPRPFADGELGRVADTLIAHRSIASLLETHSAQRDARLARSQSAAATFSQAAELAPVFGLAGTLIALSQLPIAPAPGTMLSSSIPMAIVTTFYGLMAANLLFAPLARFIERRAEEEEAGRQKLIDWLAAELSRENVRHGHGHEIQRARAAA